MLNAQYILAYSLIAITAIAAVSVFGRTIFAYGASVSDHGFPWRFDVTRLPLCITAITILAVASFCYGLLVARQLDTAIEFCLGATFFGGLGILLRIGYVPK